MSACSPQASLATSMTTNTSLCLAPVFPLLHSGFLYSSAYERSSFSVSEASKHMPRTQLMLLVLDLFAPVCSATSRQLLTLPTHTPSSAPQIYHQVLWIRPQISLISDCFFLSPLSTPLSNSTGLGQQEGRDRVAISPALGR